MIGPFDFLMLRNKRAAELESVIDHAIRNAAVLSSSSAITVASKGFPMNVVNAVVAKYRDIGWIAEFVTDGRDGDFISLEVPR